MTKHLASIDAAILLVSVNFACAQPPSATTSRLAQSFDFSAKHAASPQFFVMESKLIMYALDGKRVGTDSQKEFEL